VLYTDLYVLSICIANDTDTEFMYIPQST